jgi:hypothetical protein
MRFRQFLIELAQNKGSTISFFDIDQTILDTKALIYVIKDGKVIKKLTNQEFNTYKLKDDETFNFDEFRDAELFKQTSLPIPKVVKYLKGMFKRANVKNQKVVFLTARADFDNKNVFLSTFRDLGIPIDNIYVERTGNLKSGSTSQRKEQTVKKYLDTGKYSIAKLYDDDIKNLQGFLSLQSDYPDIQFYGIQIIDSKGKMKKI